MLALFVCLIRMVLLSSGADGILDDEQHQLSKSQLIICARCHVILNHHGAVFSLGCF